MLVDRRTLDHAVNDLWFSFLNTEKSWINKLYRWLVQDLDFYFDDYVAFLVTLRQQTFTQEISFWVRLFRNLNLGVTDFEARFWKKAGENSDFLVKSARIPTLIQIKTLIQESSSIDQLFLLILENSGRRSIDISRITSAHVRTRGSKYFATIPKDKTHQNSVTFSWEWNSECLQSPHLIEKVKRDFKNLLNSAPNPFASVKINKIRKSIDWRLHGLRHRRAIHLLRSGVSVPNTMSSIGWSCVSSLTRYTKLSVEDLKDFHSTEECIIFINN